MSSWCVRPGRTRAAEGRSASRARCGRGVGTAALKDSHCGRACFRELTSQESGQEWRGRAGCGRAASWPPEKLHIGSSSGQKLSVVLFDSKWGLAVKD